MKSSVKTNTTVKLVTRTGKIVPTAWDELDKVTEVMLEWFPREEDDPGELLLHSDDNARTLLLFLGRYVTVTGRLGKTEDGEPMLRVKRFRLHRSDAGERLVR